jgi:hypothetical protein
VDGLKANGFDFDLFFGVVTEEAPKLVKGLDVVVVGFEEEEEAPKPKGVVVVLGFEEKEEEEAPNPKGAVLAVVVVLEEDAPPPPPPKPKRLGLGADKAKDEKGLLEPPVAVAFPPPDVALLSAADWQSASFPSLLTSRQFVTMTVSSGTCFSLVWSLPILSTMSMPFVTSPKTTCFPSN